jgi:hypothetical protein
MSWHHNEGVNIKMATYLFVYEQQYLQFKIVYNFFKNTFSHFGIIQQDDGRKEAVRKNWNRHPTYIHPHPPLSVVYLHRDIF